MHLINLTPVVTYIHADGVCGGSVVPYSAATRRDEEDGTDYDLHRCKLCGLEVWVPGDRDFLRVDSVTGMADSLPRPAYVQCPLDATCIYLPGHVGACDEVPF